MSITSKPTVRKQTAGCQGLRGLGEGEMVSGYLMFWN